MKLLHISANTLHTTIIERVDAFIMFRDEKNITKLSQILKLNRLLLLSLLILGLSLLLAACGEGDLKSDQGAIFPAPVTATSTASANPTATPTPVATQPAENPGTPPATQPAENPAATPTPAEPDYKPVIWFSASTLKIGDTLTIGGNGYPPNTKLIVALGFGDGLPGGSYATPLTNNKGSFTASVKLDQAQGGNVFKPGRVVVAVTTADQTIAAGAPITLTAAAPTATPTKPASPTATPDPQSGSGRRIEVNLTQQKLMAYEGNKVVFTTLISSGVAKYPTVTGNYNIYLKYVKQTMIGGRGSDAYNLPDVPYVMYFYQDYGIHGTYWHHNFGHPMSHGCVNAPTDAAKFLYNWAAIGTPVSIHY
jgi:lipoprotein-anchoring transpeptidase ErfK/SrfK